MQWTFIETPFFMKRRNDYFDDEAFRQFQLELMADPEKGDLIQGGAGIRKIRGVEGSRGKGKRGGIRVIYLQLPEIHEIYLFHIYGKNIKDDLSKKEIEVLAELAREYRKISIARKRSWQ